MGDGRLLEAADGELMMVRGDSDHAISCTCLRREPASM